MSFEWAGAPTAAVSLFPRAKSIFPPHNFKGLISVIEWSYILFSFFFFHTDFVLLVVLNITFITASMNIKITFFHSSGVGGGGEKSFFDELS